jgi:hypothetical protein
MAVALPSTINVELLKSKRTSFCEFPETVIAAPVSPTYVMVHKPLIFTGLVITNGEDNTISFCNVI